MTNMNYEYATVIGNIRVREQRADESTFEYSILPMSDLLVVDNPMPPSQEGWDLLTTTFVMTNDVRWFVAREWRREIKAPALAGKLEMPNKELVRDWMRVGHNRVEAQARANQKAIWQSGLDDAAAEYIAERLKELQETEQ